MAGIPGKIQREIYDGGTLDVCRREHGTNHNGKKTVLQQLYPHLSPVGADAYAGSFPALSPVPGKQRLHFPLGQGMVPVSGLLQKKAGRQKHEF